MSRLRPICPACRCALSGEVVASACNHVFHRACFDSAANKPCPQCNTALTGDGYKLYGVNFGGESAVDAAAVAKALDVVDVEDPEVASIMDHMNECKRVEQLRRRLEDMKPEAEEVKQEVERQRVKLKLAEKLHNKQLADIDQKAAELSKKETEYNSLCETIQQNRDREAVYEYRDLLLAGKDKEALKYLVTTVNMLNDPAKLLTEVRRLRDHHRAALTRQQREGLEVSRKESQLRRQIEEKQRTVNKLQNRLRRSGSDGETLAFRSQALRSQGSSGSVDSVAKGT